MNGLRGKLALVTGGTGLLGRAIAARLTGEGCVVALASRSLEKAERAAREIAPDQPDLVLPLELDLRDAAGVSAALERLGAEKGVPDIFIANASNRDGLAAPFSELMPEDFDRLLSVDCGGHFLCARWIAERLTENRKSGSIVLLSSIYAVAGVDPQIYPEGMPPAPVQYATVKAALLGMMRCLAARWGAQGIRVNAMIAGGVRNPVSPQNEEFVRNYNRKTMLNRMARPDEIASGVAFLASEESSYVTGACLAIDGGFTAW